MQQLALDVRLADHALFSNFHMGSNALAVASVRALAEQGEPPFVWVWGPAGAGKSHLLQAAVAQAHGRGTSCAYLPLDELGRLPPGVLDGMGRLQLLALDEPQAVAGDDAWERALLRSYEQLLAHGGRLLVGAVEPPAGSGLVLADLRSRFSAAAIFRLQPLTEAQCREAMQQRASWLGCGLPDETLDFLLARVGRDTHNLFGLLDRLDREALAAQRRLTIPFVRSVLQTESGAVSAGAARPSRRKTP